MQWPCLLAYIRGRVDKEWLVRNQYLAAENRILRAKIKGRPQLSERDKRSLAEIAHWLGRKALAEVAVAATPDNILRWFRKQVARKFDGSAWRQSVGRPRVEKTIEDLIVRMGQENPSWGYDRSAGRSPISDITFPNDEIRGPVPVSHFRTAQDRTIDFSDTSPGFCLAGKLLPHGGV